MARSAAESSRARPRGTEYAPVPIRRAPWRAATASAALPGVAPTIHVVREAAMPAAALSPGKTIGGERAAPEGAAPEAAAPEVALPEAAFAGAAKPTAAAAVAIVAAASVRRRGIGPL